MKNNAKHPISAMWLLLIISAIGITVTGIIFNQAFYRIIPLYVSLIISLMQARANRYANLFGAGNALLYAAVNLYFKMYASAASAIFMSSPLQLATFFLWNKRKYKNSTKFRRLTAFQRFWVAIGFVLVSIIVYLVLSTANSGYRLFDTVNTLLGVLTTVLTLFSFIEYTWLQLPTAVLTIITSFVIMLDYPERITYVIYGLYSLICMIVQYFSVRKLYQEQNPASHV